MWWWWRHADDERIANWVAGVAAVLIFFGSYAYCIWTYGYLLGVGLGWLPSVIVAALGFCVFWLAWPAAIPVILIFVVRQFGRHRGCMKCLLRSHGAWNDQKIMPREREHSASFYCRLTTMRWAEALSWL